MSSLAYALTDSTTMVRRVLRHTMRNPAALIISFLLPLIMLLLFNYAFGGALNTGGVKYLDFVVPEVLILGVAYAVQATALSVNADVSEGIIDRFRTMAIARSAVLIGHVIGSTLRSLVGLVIVVLVAIVIGFRPTANLLHWLAALGIVALMLLAFAWLDSVRPGGQDSDRGGQHVGDCDAAAISQRRLRPDEHDAGLAASVHREPADVPGH